MSLFNRLGASLTTQGQNLFGATATAPPSLFSTGTSQPQSQQQQQQNAGTSLFGNAAAQQQPQQNASLFGNPSLNTQGYTQQKTGASSLFNTLPQQQQGSNLFGNTTNQQNQQTQQPQQAGSMFGQTQGNRIWNEQDLQPRQKSVQDQIQTICRKWDPQDPTNSFQTYLYNSVPKDARPFYGPGPRDDEEKWEAALRKAPKDSSTIPVLVTGFEQLGKRIIMQRDTLNMLHGRLHEINNGLTDLLRRHDLEISARAAECRRRHVRLGQKCLALATKTQVLRNRGYAMDVGEEQLKQKLMELEKKVMDPALHGRSEEIWARMVTVRDRGIALGAELERLGQAAKASGVNVDVSSVLDEETMKRVKKILEGYESQITHLNKELKELRKEYEDWETPAGMEKNGNGNGSRHSH